MKIIREEARRAVAAGLLRLAEDRATMGVDPADILIEVPPKPELGDLAVPMHPFARVFRAAPNQLAIELARICVEMKDDKIARVTAAGPYVNISVSRAYFTERIIAAACDETTEYGQTEENKGRRVMVEFSSPNTNKPLHLGHLRNDAIGKSVVNLLSASGATVWAVNLINDRGIHICKSMAAYQEFGTGETPETTGLKGDHFVGRFYVRYNEWEKQEAERASSAARALLVKWEAGDTETLALWAKMNAWAIEGIEETYEKSGITFDRIYYESETYQLGRNQIKDGLETGVFFRNEDGSVWIDLESVNLDQKILLRSDGTSVYMTQDVGTVLQRREDWPFDQLIYVVAAEQDYHFAVLFEILKRLGHDWAADLFHLSYGMVNLPDGKMKSRDGTIVDADDLIERLEQLALEEILERGREAQIHDVDTTSHEIAMSAIHYYLLQISPQREMVFDPEASISFAGNTGPYLQYTGARIESVLRTYDASHPPGDPSADYDASLLTETTEWEIVKGVSAFPDVVNQAAAELSPMYMCTFLFELARLYSRYYHDTSILHNDNPNTVAARVALSRAVRNVIRSGLGMLNIGFLERM